MTDPIEAAIWYHSQRSVSGNCLWCGTPQPCDILVQARMDLPKVSVDEKFGMRYVELKKCPEGGVKETREYDGGILIDFNADGEVLGIEILS